MLPILTTPAFASACQACSRASCCSRVACDCCLSRKAPRASRLSPSRSLPAVQRFRLDRIIAPGSCGGSGESYFPNILRLLQDVHKTQHKTELDVSEQYASARAHTPPLPPPAHAFSSPARSFSSATPHAPPSLRRRRSVSFRSRTPQQRWYDGTREPAVRGRDPSSCNWNGVRRLHGAHGRVPRTRFRPRLHPRLNYELRARSSDTLELLNGKLLD